MAGRPPKMGIDYAGWDTGMFENDTKIDKLLDAQGWRGFGVYFYLCQRAYSSNGYFYEWSLSDAPTTARKMGGGIGSQTVIDTVNLCFQIGLFDKTLFDRHGVLTNRAIQKRYRHVALERICKVVIKDYWLLEISESRGLVFHALNLNYNPSESNNDPPKSNNDPPKSNYHPQKESKVKESKRYIKDISSADELPTDSRVNQIDYARIKDAFNTTCLSLPKIDSLTDKRKKALKALLSKIDIATLINIFAKVSASDFLSGRNGKWTGCCFDWLINYNNAIKVMEGNYDNSLALQPNYQQNKPNNKFVNFKQRDWDYAEIERLEQLSIQQGLKDGGSDEP